MIEILDLRGSSLFQLADSHVLEVVCMGCSSRAGKLCVSLSVEIFVIPQTLSVDTHDTHSYGTDTTRTICTAKPGISRFR